MHNYLPIKTPDYTGEILDIEPDSMINISGNKHQILYKFKDGIPKVKNINNQSYFDVFVQWEYLTDLEYETIMDLWHNINKANGMENTFQWKNYVDGVIYVVRFMSEIVIEYIPGYIKQFYGVQLRVEGNIPLASGNNIAGFVAGGYPYTSVVDKLNFSTDNIASITSTLNDSRVQGAGFNSNTAGYIAGGGDTGGYTKVIDKLNFSNDSVNQITSESTLFKRENTGFDSQDNGYDAGGYIGSYYSGVEKLNFSTDNIASVTSKLSIPREYLASFNSQDNGYIAGGYDGSYYSNIDKLNFSNDNTYQITSKLSTAKSAFAGFNSNTAGYIAGGHPSFLSVVDKLNFSNDNTYQITSTLSIQSQNNIGFNSQENGFVAGGHYYDGTEEKWYYLSVVDKLNFNNDTINQITSTLSTAPAYAVGFEN